MKYRTIKKDVTIELTQAELAEAFCSMDANDQADFLRNCADIAKTWDDNGFERQWLAVHAALFADRTALSVGHASDLLSLILHGES